MALGLQVPHPDPAPRPQLLGLDGCIRCFCPNRPLDHCGGLS